MVDPCTQKMKEQVQEELSAAMTYFAMVRRGPAARTRRISLLPLFVFFVGSAFFQGHGEPSGIREIVFRKRQRRTRPRHQDHRVPVDERRPDERSQRVDSQSRTCSSGARVFVFANFSNFVQQPLTDTWANGLAALKDALTLEAQVTRKIIGIAKVCEDPNLGVDKYFNDYHVSFAPRGQIINWCKARPFAK